MTGNEYNKALQYIIFLYALKSMKIADSTIPLVKSMKKKSLIYNLYFVRNSINSTSKITKIPII